MSKKSTSLFSLIFVSLTQMSPVLNRYLWKKWYNFIAKHDSNNLLTAMNYGYIDDNVSTDPLSSPQLKLYEHVIDKVLLHDKKVLEVGSGRGAGALYLTTKFNPLAYIALDMAFIASKKADELTENPCLHAVSGDALAIPVKQSSIDVIINIESSHCYSNLEKFIEEVSRSLNQGGIFCYCDLMPVKNKDRLLGYFEKHSLKVKKINNITQQVLRSLAYDSGQHSELINKHVPWYLKKTVSEFAGIKGTAVYNLFDSGKFVYYSFQVEKI